MAPSKLLSVFSQRQLRFKYLGELFQADGQHTTPDDLDNDDDDEVHSRRSLIGDPYRRRRVLYRRSLHEMSTQSDEGDLNDVMEIMTTSFNPYRRRLHDRSLHQSEDDEEITGDMEIMTTSFNPYRRRLHDRSLHQSEEITEDEEEITGDMQSMMRFFNPYRRRLQQYGRRLHKSMRRSLSQHGRSLMQSYGRRLRTIGSWGRRLKGLVRSSLRRLGL